MEWISVKDKMPQKDGTPFLGYGKDELNENYECLVMIYYQGGKDHNGYEMDKGFYAIGQWGLYNREHACNPEYWIPLPKKPEIE